MALDHDNRASWRNSRSRCATASVIARSVCDNCYTPTGAWHGPCCCDRSLPSTDRQIGRARTLARVLDHFGLDPWLGLLLPGIGDLAGSLIGLYIVAVAIKRRLSTIVIARMVLNLGIDMAVGAIPLIGDIFDFAFKASSKNLRLLETRQPARSTPGDWAVLGAAVTGFIGAIALIVYGVIAVIRHLG